MNKPVIFRWRARILGIAIIGLISLFSLDAFSGQQSFLQEVGAFLLHLVPSLVLLAVLILAWRNEFIGGIMFLLIGLVFAPFIYSHNLRANHSVATSLSDIAVINFPLITVGILFLLSHYFRTGKEKIQ